MLPRHRHFHQDSSGGGRGIDADGEHTHRPVARQAHFQTRHVRHDPNAQHRSKQPSSSASISAPSPSSAPHLLARRRATLQRAIDEDTALGRVPFIVIATIGTTSSGAVDDLTSLLAVVRAHPTLWMHIDAAYAGVVYRSPRCGAQMHLDAINAEGGVDSFSTNLHSGGLVQFDCSPLLVRDRGDRQGRLRSPRRICAQSTAMQATSSTAQTSKSRSAAASGA